MRLKSLASLSCAAASGVMAGALIERRRNGNPAAHPGSPPAAVAAARKLPGLPVFGTVSAATPISEGVAAVPVPAPSPQLKVSFTVQSSTCKD